LRNESDVLGEDAGNAAPAREDERRDRTRVERVLHMQDVDAGEEPLKGAPEVQGRGKGIWDAEVALRTIARGHTFDQVTIGLLVHRALRLSPAAEDDDVVATVGEPAREVLYEPLDAADVGAEVGGHEQEARAGKSRQMPFCR
jgi:hypothetical protein